MSKGPNKEVRERCPRCMLTDIYKRVTRAYICKRCKHEFTDPFIGTRYQKRAGSGVIAGKIEIGKGHALWGRN